MVADAVIAGAVGAKLFGAIDRWVRGDPNKEKPNRDGRL